MADRRMFSKNVTESDLFLDMPASAQALYFHLAMHADDDGFVGNPKKIMRMVAAADDDARLLITKRFLIPFESGVVVIRHWRIHNYIQKDRYRETIYTEEKSAMCIQDNKAYSLRSGDVQSLDTGCIQSVSEMDAQNRLGKDRIGKDREGENVAGKPPAPTKPIRKAYGEFGWVKLSDDEYNRLSNDLGEAEVKRCIAYVDESAQTTGNKNKWRDWNLVIRKCHKQGWGTTVQQKNGGYESGVDRLARMYKEEFGE